MDAIFAETIYTGTKVINNGYLLFEGSTIKSVSKKKPDCVLTRHKVITPAFVDPHSHIGMHRSNEPSDYGEVNERLAPMLALVDPLDTLQMDDPAFGRAIEMGVLYSCILPGSGNIIGGTSAIIRHYASNSSKAFIDRAGMKMAFGWNTIKQQAWQGERPNTRMGCLAILRRYFYQIQDKIKKKEDLSREEAIVADILKGKLRVRAHCHRADDIATLLRLADEFGLDITLEHAADIDDVEIFEELRDRGISVTYGPLGGCAPKLELRNYTWRNVFPLLESGVDFALMTDHPITWAHDLFLLTRYFLRAGMSRQDAIELVTRRNAEQIGIADRVGTLTKGKWASFVCWDCDPFDLASTPASVYGEGKLLYSGA